MNAGALQNGFWRQLGVQLINSQVVHNDIVKYLRLEVTDLWSEDKD